MNTGLKKIKFTIIDSKSYNKKFSVSMEIGSGRFLKENNIPDVNIFTIPFSRDIYKAQMKGRPISHYAPHSDVGRAYKRVAKEIMDY